MNNNDNLKEKILNMRMNEFGFSKVSFLGEPKDDVFPYALNVVKHEKIEPTKVFSAELNDYVLITEHSYVIGTLTWDKNDPGWEFKSCGLRYLKEGTEELNKWILDFCHKYEIANGELYLR